MFKNIFRIRNKEGSQEDYLAPETRPIINGRTRVFIVKKEDDTTPPERISYRLIMRRRREHDHRNI